METPRHPRLFMQKEMVARWLTAETMAEQIGQPKESVEEVLEGIRPISPLFALALEKYWGLDAEMWLNWQAGYDLHQARQAMTNNA